MQLSKALQTLTSAGLCEGAQGTAALPASAHQNLNSGSRLTKGRNSSCPLEGSVGPSSSGSTWGVRNPSSRFRL